MKVRAKLALLLLGVIAIFVAGLIAIKAHDHKRFRVAADVREKERRTLFEEYVRHRGESLETFASYLSCLDDLVAAIARGDRARIETILSEDVLNIYRAHAVWIYKADGELVATRNILYSAALPEVPLPSGAFKPLLDSARLCHFFAETPLGLMEIRGATVHPSADATRKTEPRGYFFAGRLWTKEDIKEMALFTGNEIDLVSPADAVVEPSVDPETGAVSFASALTGWDGRPVALLSVRSESSIVKHLNSSTHRQFLWLIIFVLVLFLALVLALTQLVSQPLEALSNCLKLHDLSHLHRWQDSRCEFGDLARLIRAFFVQREDLLREITGRRQTEDALQQSEERLRHSQKMEAVGRLAGGIAHDFNNLLTAIIGYADLIAQRAPDATARHDAELIRKAGQQAADLTRQLLAFSRKQILQPRVLDLNRLLLDLEKLLQRIIGEHIELHVHAEADHGRVCADPTQLEQVIINLAVNARDAMPRGGVLTIRTATAFLPETLEEGGSTLPPGRYVAVSVQDTGSGMDAETKQHIFEPFFTTKDPGQGTGLGLATVYGIVQQSGGAIVVNSKPGEGATFTIHLPEADAPVETVREAAQAIESSGHSETVLVIEDEEIVRDLICNVLSQQGYEVLCASRGVEGLDEARQHPGRIDLLITDIVMPQMTGPEIARELREIQPETKVLFVSGYSDSDIVGQVARSHQMSFLEKPFTPADLTRKVRELLDEEEHALVMH